MTPLPPYILNFSEKHSTDLPLVGGKGANLSEMTHAGFPVPEGYCVTTAAFRRFMDASGQAEAVYVILESDKPSDIESTRRVGTRVRASLLNAPIPDDVAAAIRDAWRAIGTEHAYAVRSSATAEDLPDASFAGQQDTYLNVRGDGPLLDAIRRCWVSLFTDRAISYRYQNGFDHRDVGIAVVVQRMVMSEISGILFTADPVTGHRNTLTIDASFGLGEALVGGLVTPDSFRVDKHTRTIVERRTADKEVAIYPEPDGGTRQVSLPAAMRTRAVLTDLQVLRLTDLGCRIEAHYGRPQDIEWAISDENEYLLQARPITSLYPIDGLQSPDSKLHVFFSLGHQQMMPRAMTPLSLSTIQVLLPVGHRKDRLDNAYVRTAGGRLFADITRLLRHPITRKAVLGLLAQLDALAPRAVEQVAQRSGFHGHPGLHVSVTALKNAVTFIFRMLDALLRRNLTGFAERTSVFMDGFVSDVSDRLRMVPSGRAQLEALLEALPDMFPLFLNWLPEAGAGMAAARLLARLARRRLSPDQLESLTQGIPGNVVTTMNLAIGELAELSQQSDELVAWFDQLGDDANAWLAAAARLDGSAEFMHAWSSFLARYGARGPSEIDIASPRWYEDPLPVLRVIAEHIRNATFSRAHFQGMARARDVAFTRLLENAGRGPFGWLRARIFRRLYAVMTEVGGLREHHKFLVIRVLAVAKEVLKDVAMQLVAAGRLARPDDLWFLTWRELLGIWDDDSTSWDTAIAQRSAELERYQKLKPPLIITSDGESPVVQYRVKDAPPGALLGNPVSPGVVEGVAHVIHDPAAESLKPGEILVAPFTDPGWTPLFINAAGLIVEIGGPLTHGAVVAREYGIAAVVGVRNATRDIRTGERVRVDGNRGVVEIL